MRLRDKNTFEKKKHGRSRTEQKRKNEVLGNGRFIDDERSKGELEKDVIETERKKSWARESERQRHTDRDRETEGGR